jgi:hypothetical protein
MADTQGPDEIDPAYRDRVLAAYRALCDRESVRLIRDAEIARRMVEFDPTLKTGYQQAGRLLGGTRSRHRPTMIAFANVLGVDPGWLDYGDASMAPRPQFVARTPRAAPVPRVNPVPVDEARARRAQAKKTGRHRRGS